MPTVALIRRSVGLGAGLGAAWLAASMAVLIPLRDNISRATPALVLVVGVVAAGLVGGVLAAVVVSVASAAALNLAFIPPYGTFKINAWEDWIALAVFLAVASAIGVLVASEVDRRRAAEQREAELRSLYEELAGVAAERTQLAEEAARAQVLARVDEQRAARPAVGRCRLHPARPGADEPPRERRPPRPRGLGRPHHRPRPGRRDRDPGGRRGHRCPRVGAPVHLRAVPAGRTGGLERGGA